MADYDPFKKAIGFVFLLFVSLFANHLFAQSLTQQLLQQPAERLVADAKAKGDIVRGAILYHQGNINCARCHRSAGQVKPIGPDLGQLAADVKDTDVVSSILQPSKEIRKGYETQVVLTIDGRTLTGTVADQNAEQIVLYDQQNVGKQIIIPRDQIDDFKISDQSVMPDDLVDQLKNKQQFLDLLRFVLQLRDQESSAQKSVQNQNQRTLTSRLAGLNAISKYSCAACHDLNNSLRPHKQPPDLKWSATNLNTDYLLAHIRDPQTAKPGSSMPSMLDHLEQDTRNEATENLTHFLVSLTQNNFKTEAIDKASIRRGHSLFGSVGCVACHSPRDMKSTEQVLRNSEPLGDVTSKYNLTSLREFLLDPLSIRPSGHMPGMGLNFQEATDIASFLLQNQSPKTSVFMVDESKARLGKSLFRDLNCANCHVEVADISKGKKTDLAGANLTMGCLSDKTDPKVKHPRFPFTESEKQNIVTALESTEPVADQRMLIDAELTYYNCVACHQRDGLGGVSPKRNPHFQTTNLNLGDQGRLPPSLTGAGAKLKPAWMREVLVAGKSIRPYMNTRMPQFGEQNVAKLIKLLGAADPPIQTEFANLKDKKKAFEYGHLLAGNKGLNCVACHTFQYKISDTMPAVDLTEMTDRLRKEWFYEYMLNPQKFSPNTVMPSFWPNGKAMRKDLEGTPKEQIEAMWEYLLAGRQARVPSGVVRKPLEIVVTNKAQVLRRKYPGIGKRGIGVGYPGGANIAFDAEQLRLGLIWKGRFAEASGVWKGQGSGNVQPLSRPIEFIKGPDLDSAVNPWKVDDGRPPHHQFNGYQLDHVGRPTFLYSMNNVNVKDYFVETQTDDGKLQLKRNITLVANQDTQGLRFKVATGASIKKSESKYLLGKNLTVVVNAKDTSKLVGSDVSQFVVVDFDLEKATEKTIEVVYSWINE